MSLLPHRICLIGDPLLVYGNFVFDIIIWSCYMGLAYLLIFSLHNEPDKKNEITSSKLNDFENGIKHLIIMFSAFIFLCGTTHLIDAWAMFDNNIFYIQLAVKGMTAFISFLTLGLTFHTRHYLRAYLHGKFT